jgi:two-component system phosphate regulon sensor histidine kinase PhoR
MAAVEFILGLSIGIGIHLWRQYLFKNQLKKLLQSFSPPADWITSLPVLSIVRRELTYLHQQQQQLERDRQVWQELMEQAPVGYLRVDGENQLLWCNQQTRKLLKIDRWQPGQVRLLLELVRSYELDQLIEKTRQLQQPQVQEWVFYFTGYVSTQKETKNQTDLSYSSPPVSTGVQSVALAGYSFPLPQNEVGIFLLDRQELLEISQTRDRAFADLTHELRTPLTSISLVAENLLKRLQDPERRWVEQMLRETNRLIQLVQEWLDLAQLQADPIKSLQYQALDLGELIFSVWHALEPLAQKKRVTFVYSSKKKVSLEADKSRLIQVFFNLLDNAIKHSPIGGQIFVAFSNIETNSVSETNQTIKIDIIDSGTGFTSADLPYVFQRLYRGDKSRTRQASCSVPASRGSGLGLAIVQQIIQAHGGSITAKNHPETGGAWLEINLPPKKSQKILPNSVTENTISR